MDCVVTIVLSCTRITSSVCIYVKGGGKEGVQKEEKGGEEMENTGYLFLLGINAIMQALPSWLLSMYDHSGGVGFNIWIWGHTVHNSCLFQRTLIVCLFLKSVENIRIERVAFLLFLEHFLCLSDSNLLHKQRLDCLLDLKRFKT